MQNPPGQGRTRCLSLQHWQLPIYARSRQLLHVIKQAFYGRKQHVRKTNRQTCSETCGQHCMCNFQGRVICTPLLVQSLTPGCFDLSLVNATDVPQLLGTKSELIRTCVQPDRMAASIQGRDTNASAAIAWSADAYSWYKIALRSWATKTVIQRTACLRCPGSTTVQHCNLPH